MRDMQKWLKDKCNQDYSLGELSNLKYLHLGRNKLTIKPNKNLIKFLDKFEVNYNIAQDSLVTEILI